MVRETRVLIEHCFGLIKWSWTAQRLMVAFRYRKIKPSHCTSKPNDSGGFETTRHRKSGHMAVSLFKTRTILNKGINVKHTTQVGGESIMASFDSRSRRISLAKTNWIVYGVRLRQTDLAWTVDGPSGIVRWFRCSHRGHSRLLQPLISNSFIENQNQPDMNQRTVMTVSCYGFILQLKNTSRNSFPCHLLETLFPIKPVSQQYFQSRYLVKCLPSPIGNPILNPLYQNTAA